MTKIPYYRGESGMASIEECRDQLSASNAHLLEKRARPKEIGCVDLSLRTTRNTVQMMRPHRKPNSIAS